MGDFVMGEERRGSIGIEVGVSAGIITIFKALILFYECCTSGNLNLTSLEGKSRCVLTGYIVLLVVLYWLT